jgi:hypothetical protein
MPNSCADCVQQIRELTGGQRAGSATGMSTRTYSGSCQCGRVRFEADMDLSAQPSPLVRPHAFRLLAGEADLSDMQFGPMLGHNLFCRHCRIRPFGKGRLAALGGEFYFINLATLDLETSEPASTGIACAG